MFTSPQTLICLSHFRCYIDLTRFHMQVALAETQLPQLQQQAQAAAAQLQPVQLQQKQQGQVYAQQAPQLLQHAEALLPPIKDCHAAATQTTPRLQAMHKDITQLKAQLMVRSCSRYASSNQCTGVELLFAQKTALKATDPHTQASFTSKRPTGGITI